MALTADDIIKIMEKAAELGLIEKPSPKPTDSMDPAKAYTQGHVLDEMSEEEILYWSTPHYDDLQAEKEEKKRRLQEESLAEGRV